jgi:hypothetical protein
LTYITLPVCIKTVYRLSYQEEMQWRFDAVQGLYANLLISRIDFHNLTLFDELTVRTEEHYQSVDAIFKFQKTVQSRLQSKKLMNSVEHELT